jgi:hypothetical protein
VESQCNLPGIWKRVVESTQRKDKVGVLVYDVANSQSKGDSQISGILGLSVLEGFQVTLDYKHSCLTIQLAVVFMKHIVSAVLRWLGDFFDSDGE